jgi:mannose-1-phosphate guanylyltransferase
MQPTRPDPDYGYLTRGWPLEANGETFTVGAYFARPDAALAERVVRRGGLWNSSVMVCRLDTLLAEVARLVPDRLEVMRRVARRPEERDDAYAAIEPWSFGREVFPRLVESMLVVPVADVGWSDWRTPQAIARSLAARQEKPLWWTSAAAAAALVA